MLGEVEILSPNVALNGTATQITNFHHRSRFSDPDYALYAIDGNFSTDILNSKARCAITLNNMVGAWWQVDLMNIYRVEKVALTTRKCFGIIFILVTFDELNYQPG